MTTLSETVRWVKTITLEADRLTADGIVVRRDMVVGARSDEPGVRWSFVVAVGGVLISAIVSALAFLETRQFFNPDYTAFALSLLPLAAFLTAAVLLRPRQHLTVMLRDGSALAMLIKDPAFLTVCLEAFERLWADPSNARASLYIHAEHQSAELGAPDTSVLPPDTNPKTNSVSFDSASAGALPLPLSNAPDDIASQSTVPALPNEMHGKISGEMVDPVIEPAFETVPALYTDHPIDVTSDTAGSHTLPGPPSLNVVDDLEGSSEGSVDSMPGLAPADILATLPPELTNGTLATSILPTSSFQEGAPVGDPPLHGNSDGPDVAIEAAVDEAFASPDWLSGPWPSDEQESSAEKASAPHPSDGASALSLEQQPLPALPPTSPPESIDAQVFVEVYPRVVRLARLLRDRKLVRGLGDAIDILEVMTRRGCAKPSDVRGLVRAVAFLRQHLSIYPSAIALLDDVQRLGRLPDTVE
ncbi:MAG: hypothetical protein AAF590_02190 [Pseudomonadota bacterium]